MVFSLVANPRAAKTLGVGTCAAPGTGISYRTVETVDDHAVSRGA